MGNDEVKGEGIVEMCKGGGGEGKGWAKRGRKKETGG